MKLKRPSMKKGIATLTFISLAFAASLTYSLLSGHSTSAKSAYTPSNMSAAPAASSSAISAAAQITNMPRTPILALDTDNTIFILVPGTTSFVQLVRVPDGNVAGNLIGLDFRPAQGNNNVVYAVTDTGNIYTISLRAGSLGAATLVSTMTPGLPSGYQSLMDFNPVVDAIRLIGSDTLNYAVVKGANGILNTTAVQTSLTYNANDVARGTVPKISAGSYTNNVNGATVTIFYACDYNRDSFVTIDPAAAGGSSATGGGVLRTIGPLVTSAGARINISSTADIDIYTTNGINRLVGVSGRTFFTADLAQVTGAAALGTQKNIIAPGIPMNADLGARFVDVAAALTRYEAENGTVGGGSRVDAVNTGFTGTGYVNFTDGAAGGSVRIDVNQAGPQTIIFRYANGSAANRPCNVTVNGTLVGTVAFPPTGSFSTFRTVTLPVNLPINSAFKALQITSTTAAGGPDLDWAELN
jgi:uncharacterized protein DUF4394/carbohydrate binding protein with CBM35 domain